MGRPRYGNKKKKRTSNGAQPPDRGHGLQERESGVESAGANGNGHLPTRRKLRREGASALAEALRGPKMDHRGSLLSPSDRHLIRELTEALRENSALLAGDEEPSVSSGRGGSVGFASSGAPEEKPQETAQPEDAASQDDVPPEDDVPPPEDTPTQPKETASPSA